MVGTNLNTTPGDKNFAAPLSEEVNSPRTLATINNIKSPHTETIIGVVTLKTVLFAMFHDMFRLLPINCNNMKKEARQMIFI
jgi:hypothetical protein